MALRFTLRQLEYFVAVGEAGSIAMASEKVNVSSPSISAAVSQLEQEFGLPLFVRKHAHGLSLTQAGRQFMIHAQDVLTKADQLNALASNISGNVQGPLSIGCLVTFAQMILPSLRRKFEAQFPDVRIRQIEAHQQDIFNKIRNVEIDIALTYDLDIPADFTFVPLAKLPPYALVNEVHPIAHLPAVSVEELQPHPMVLLDLPLSSDYFLSFFTKAGLRPNISERTRDMAVMRSLVANGFGYSIANIRPLSDYSPDGHLLRFIPLTGNIRPMQMGLLMAKGTDDALTVRAFIDHCQDLINDDNIPGIKTRVKGVRRDV